MREYIDVTGRNEEDAIAKALQQLNLDRDDVSVEILERAKSGFLGIGSCPARVRVYYGEEEPVFEVQPEPEVNSAPLAEPEPVPELRREEKKKQPTVERSREKKRPPQKPDVPENPVSDPDFGEEVHDEKAEAVRAFLSGLLERLDTPAEIHVYLLEKGRYKVILEGPGMGGLIGRRGETLDAIQQLTSYAVNRSNNSSRVRVQLDAEGYRAKREQSLQHLAQKVAAKVVKYRRSVTLEPMNAYERHVIHTALQEFPGVTTHSTGSEPNRRIIVSYVRI